jgi:hypothetical protein
MARQCKAELLFDERNHIQYTSAVSSSKQESCHYIKRSYKIETASGAGDGCRARFYKRF